MEQVKKLVVGAGPTGRLTATLLATAGYEVTLVSRRGVGAAQRGVIAAALDASDQAALTTLAAGATTIFNCAMPRYDRWPQEFPPIANAVLGAALRTGADLVTLSNVYGYGAVPGTFVESLPMAPISIKGRVRAQMWEQALSSGARVTEVRASDYLGHGAASLFTLMVLPYLVRGESARFPGDLDALHSWTYTLDVARTLVAASSSEVSWGRAWHVPSNDLSVRALADRLAWVGALPVPALSSIPGIELAALAASGPMMREVAEMSYLFEQPSILDSAETRRALEVSATPIDEVLRNTLCS